MKLNEGMREGDLADMVLPLISVDEYTSDVDPTECIVFGLYVHDEDAANDLNRFLQKSATPILDTKVSPAPDQHGYYMVFVELMDNARLPEIVAAILAEIKGLVDIEDWQMRIRKTDGLVPFSEDNLKDALKGLNDHNMHESIMKFLDTSLLSDVLFEGDLIMLQAGAERHLHRMVSFDRIDSIMEKENLTESPLMYDIRSVAKLNRIRRSLGEHWEVSRLGHYVMLHNSDDPRGLLLKM